VVFHEMLTGRRLFQAKNDITRMRQLLSQTVVPPSALNAGIPRELDRIVMRSLEMDPEERYQSTADMASDLERTLIAARYSSRELSKLLHGLFLPDEDPLVVVDTGDGHTVALTGSSPGTASGTGTGTGTRSGSGSGTTGSSSGSRTGPRTTGPRPAETSMAEPIPDVEEAVKRRSESGARRMEKVLRAEQGRLARARFRGRAKVFVVAGGIALLVGAAVWAGHRYLPALLASPPAAKPVLPVPLPNQDLPVAPAVKPPPKKRPTRRKAQHAAPAGNPTPTEGTPAAGDESGGAEPQ